jgi:predicted dehydrogenase
MRTLHAAIIGCGNISKYHVDGIGMVGSELRYACDMNPKAAKAVAAQTGAIPTPDYHQVLQDEAIDVVHVVVNSNLHRKICIEALEAGKHVICEKTLSESAQDSLAITEAAQRTGKMLFTSYMKRYIPSVIKAKSLLGEIGQVISARFFTRQMWGDLWNGIPSDEFFRIGKDGRSEVVKRYGGGILHCGGSHILDLICFLLGLPEKVRAHQVRPDYLDYDVKTTATFEIGGNEVQFEALAHPLPFNGFLGDGWDEGFEIIGTKGRLNWKSSLWDDVESKSSVLVYQRESGESSTYQYHPVSPFTLAIEAFHKDIKSGSQTIQSIHTGYHVDRLIETMVASSANGTTEKLPW